jgi:hypothetical protein
MSRSGGLAAFADQLTDDEWNTQVIEGGTPGRSVGVNVHHVATTYPIEIDLARAIASGKVPTNVTWDVVRDLNAKRALSLWLSSIN